MHPIFGLSRAVETCFAFAVEDLGIDTITNTRHFKQTTMTTPMDRSYYNSHPAEEAPTSPEVLPQRKKLQVCSYATAQNQRRRIDFILLACSLDVCSADRRNGRCSTDVLAVGVDQQSNRSARYSFGFRKGSVSFRECLSAISL